MRSLLIAALTLVGVLTAAPNYTTAQLGLASPGEQSGAPQTRKGHKGIIEGFVRDDTGKPVKGAYITVELGSYTTQGSPTILPIYVPNVAVGAVVLNDPDITILHKIGWHKTRTDKHGHFKLKNLREGTYQLRAELCTYRNRSACGITSRDRRKFAVYRIPDSQNAAVTSGETVQHDVVFAHGSQ